MHKVTSPDRQDRTKGAPTVGMRPMIDMVAAPFLSAHRWVIRSASASRTLTFGLSTPLGADHQVLLLAGQAFSSRRLCSRTSGRSPNLGGWPPGR